MIPQMPLSLKEAQTVVELARAHAETIGVPMNIAVVDGGGDRDAHQADSRACLDAAHGTEVERAASIPRLRWRSEMAQTLAERNKQLALKGPCAEPSERNALGGALDGQTPYERLMAKMRPGTSPAS